MAPAGMGQGRKEGRSIGPRDLLLPKSGPARSATAPVVGDGTVSLKPLQHSLDVPREALLDLWQRYGGEWAETAPAETGAPPNQHQSIFEKAGRGISILADIEGRLLGRSEAARLRSDFTSPRHLDELHLAAADVALMQMAARRVIKEPEAPPVVLRLRSTVPAVWALVRVSSVVLADHPEPLALISGTELTLPESFDTAMIAAFALGVPEVHVLRHLVLGASAEEISRVLAIDEGELAQMLTELCLRTNADSLLGLLTLSLECHARYGKTACPPPPDRPKTKLPPTATSVSELGLKTMPLGDGRLLEWREFGDPSGRPVLLLHSPYGFIAMNPSATRAARQRGLRFIVPLRAGYGNSTPLNTSRPWRAGVTADSLALLGQLSISKLTVIALGFDLRLALHLAQQAPDLVEGILGIGAPLPIATPEQFERLGKRQRFIMRNARYAPTVLPQIIASGMEALREIGPEATLRVQCDGSPADIATLDDPEIRDALSLGLHHSLLSGTGARHLTLARDCRDAGREWGELASTARVPVRLLQGDQDVLSPLANTVEALEGYPKFELTVFEGAGQFLLWQRWPEVLDALEELIYRG